MERVVYINEDVHLTWNVLLHYLVKVKDSKNASDLHSIHNTLMLCSSFYDSY